MLEARDELSRSRGGHAVGTTQRHSYLKWLKRRPKSGPDCFICAEIVGQRHPARNFSAQEYVGVIHQLGVLRRIYYALSNKSCSTRGTDLFDGREVSNVGRARRIFQFLVWGSG